MKPSLRWMLDTPELKICTRCLTVNQASEMYRPGICKKCSNKKSLEWRHKKYGPPRVKLTDEELLARRKAREAAKAAKTSKTGWSGVELRAYQKSTTSLLELAKAHFFPKPPKVFRTAAGKGFDTEFERDEYVRGWREYREWCAENREAIKRAAMDRSNAADLARARLRGVMPMEEVRARAVKTKRERQRWKDYKKRKTGAGGARLPWDFEENQLAAQGGCCFYCRVEVGDEYHLDHILPVAKGGKHRPENLVISCPACNMKKSDKDPWAFSWELMQAA